MQATWKILNQQYFFVCPWQLLKPAMSRKTPKCYEVFLLILRPRIRWNDGIKCAYFKGIRVFGLDKICWIYYTDQWRDLIYYMKQKRSTKSDQFLIWKNDYRLRCLELDWNTVSVLNKTVLHMPLSKGGSYWHSLFIPSYQNSQFYQGIFSY